MVDYDFIGRWIFDHVEGVREAADRLIKMIDKLIDKYG